MIYRLVLGDWSKDGHGYSKDVLIECNCNDVVDIQNAYKASCKKLGVQFNDDKDYTGKICHMVTHTLSGQNMAIVT